LAGRPERLKGYSIGVEVFGRPETFDPVVDPIVRIEAARLSEKLRDYYNAIGTQDPIRIDLPKGAYTPQIKFRRERVKGDRTTREKPPATVPAIAILPFEDLSAERGLGYLGDGVSEDIITSLSRFPDLAVVARSSSFAYKGKAVDIRKIGKELGVEYVVEGSIRKNDDKVRIVAQLIDTKNGEHVWAERFDRSGADPWALQDDVIGMIVSAIAGEQGALSRLSIAKLGERAPRRHSKSMTIISAATNSS
jgi:TolB-like protein